MEGVPYPEKTGTKRALQIPRKMGNNLRQSRVTSNGTAGPKTLKTSIGRA
jgi:hypothetical protein